VKNPFKIGEKVITKVDGQEVEAVVTSLFQNEVQVRTPDNELRWRTIYTVWYPGAAPLPRSQKTTKSVGIAVGANNASKSALASQPKKTKRSAQERPKKRR